MWYGLSNTTKFCIFDVFRAFLNGSDLPGKQKDQLLIEDGLICLGEPRGIRTSGPQLRRLLLYPAELWTHASKNDDRYGSSFMERVMGIEPT